jgi:lysozyme family protein
MADFKRAAVRLGKWEGFGVYTNDPDDPGGGTVHGITMAVARRNDWRGPMCDMPLDFAMNIYKRNYWEPLSLDFFESQPIAEQLFQAGVNQGVGLWQKHLQYAVNQVVNKADIVKIDGNIGTQTISVVNMIALCGDDKKLSEKIYELQENRYTDIIAKNPKLEKFRKGWHNRAADFLITTKDA